jgi:hypothetical protein
MSALIACNTSIATANGDAPTSRVYVVGYPCAATGEVAGMSSSPTVTLYDQGFYGDSANPIGEHPSLTITRAATDEVDFYFDVRPGNYDAFVHFPTQDPKSVCGRNGPLVVIPGKDRHLFVAAMSGVTDWHSPAAIAGTLPLPGVRVSVLLYDHPMRCGDDVRSFDPNTFKPTNVPHISGTIIDGGAYYTNFHAYGKQDHTLALEFSGALFTHGVVLLTVTPETSPNKPPFIEKDITKATLHAAMDKPFAEKLICIQGF